MRFLLPVFAIVILITVYAGAATTPVSLVQIDSKDFGDTNSLIQIEELERDAKTSKLRMTHQKMGSSVGSSMFIMRGFYEVAKSRGAEYFINLNERDDKEGGRIYIAGFTNTKDADLKQEFGAEYDYSSEFGQKRGYMSVSQLKGMFETPAGNPVPSVKIANAGNTVKKDANEPDVASSTDTKPQSAAPTAQSMRELGAQAGHGDIGAIDRIEEIRNELYQDIDYQKDRKRAISNLVLMQAAFDEIARSVKGSDAADPAFRSLLYATGKNRLASFTSDAFGKAAAMGHKPSLDVLLHHNEHGILLSSAVFGLTMPAEKGNEQAITFLAAVIDNDSQKPLWYGASKGLVMAANQGNPVAQRAMSKFSEHGQGKAQQANQPNIKYSLSDRFGLWAKSLQPISGLITAISILLNLVFLFISVLLGYFLFRKRA